MREAEARRFDLEGRVAGIRRAQSEGRRELNGQLRELQAARTLSSPYYGSTDLYAQVWIERSVAQDAVFLERLRGFEAAVEKEARWIDKEREALREQSRRTAREHGRRAGQIEGKARALREARTQRDRTLARVSELEASARAMSRLIEDLSRGSPSRSRPAGTMTRHSLPWPVEGRVVSGFGKREIPELQTWTIQHGIELSAVPGADVRAVRGGEVLFAGPFRSYGQVVILDHGAQLFSLYGRLGRLATSKGRSVAAGEVVGGAGSAAGGEGALYFEIRRKGDALNPIAWLQRRP